MDPELPFEKLFFKKHIFPTLTHTQLVDILCNNSVVYGVDPDSFVGDVDKLEHVCREL